MVTHMINSYPKRTPLEEGKELEEIGFVNIEVLLNKWGLECRYVPGYDCEIEILANWRIDRNFGSVRFNLNRGIGADFAERALTQDEITKALGSSFRGN